MKRQLAFLGRLCAILSVLAAVSVAGCAKKDKEKDKDKDQKPHAVQINAEINSAPWARLLAKYVDEKGLVDYARWKEDRTDRDSLRMYVEAIAKKPNPAAGGVERVSALANAYNALTISWILENYPIRSIRATRHGFTEKRFTVGGEKVSLDDIEKNSLAPIGGYRIHGLISCASRSCPPLARDAFGAAKIEDQMNRGMAVWLAREDLNTFHPDQKTVEISQVFQWNAGDFDKAGGVQKVLARHAPPGFRDFLRGKDFKISYKTYDWGLNDQGGEGHHYSRIRQGIDALRDRLR
ncbi:MAG: DUF547 domain-containing protein [Acidobacteriota bacterium]|nr:DUF547 domain-containing protein [Acidobacteriota bacterium]